MLAGAPKRKAWAGRRASPPPGSLADARQRPSPPNKPVVTATQVTGLSSKAVDLEGRPFDFAHVVVNFANVGATYGEKVLKRRGQGATGLFDYEGVRRCVKHLTHSCGLKVIGVIYENWWLSDRNQQVQAVPKDIAALCESIELTPRITGSQHRSADDEMTIKCAYWRNCRFLDNDNYKDWREGMRDQNVKAWLERYQEWLQMRFFFDSGCGRFDTLDGNISVEDGLKRALACNKQ